MLGPMHGPKHGNDIAERLLGFTASQQAREYIVTASRRLTYGEARDGMLAYAGWLESTEGVGPGDRVALCLPRTPETLQLVFGILAAGAVYVPLQFNGPPDRLWRILGSLRPCVLITTGAMAAKLRAAGDSWLEGIRIVAVDEGGGLQDILRGAVPRQGLVDVAPDDLAVIFFTSGSTGEPKGVMWSQRSMAAALASLSRWRRRSTSTPHGDDRLLALAPLQYSASAEIFYPVFTAASMYLLDDREILLADRIAEVMETERTTVWSASATALRLLAELGGLEERDLRCLRRVEMYGERMPMAALRTAMAALPGTAFHNLYAASEAFDMIEYEVPRPLPAEMDALPLGRPSVTYQLSLRDEEGGLVGPGETGEICVVGAAVTVGYWGDPALSEAKRLGVVADSYRTGDLARLDPDGLYYLVGRRDHVVKLRGHRFDLGEIETAARGEPRVRDAIAIALSSQTQGDLALAILAQAGDDWNELRGALTRILAARLPSFARPERFIFFDAFPLLASGKVDRRRVEALVLAHETDKQ
ncbi:MAG TPA: AMP-binding protein [Dongiaceae bacterium]